MRKLDKAQQALVDAAAAKVAATARAVQAGHEALTEKLEELLEPLGAAVEAYNEAAEEWNDVVQGVLDDIESYMGDRSEKWSDGEVGQAYERWREAVENAKLEPAEVPDPPEVGMPEVSELDEALPVTVDEFR